MEKKREGGPEEAWQGPGDTWTPSCRAQRLPSPDPGSLEVAGVPCSSQLLRKCPESYHALARDLPLGVHLKPCPAPLFLFFDTFL